jgi:flavin reductase (DIM6/NTAB) family NADH-FMN oxidoreductase RutF
MNTKNKKTILRKMPSGLLIVTAKDGKQGTGAVISFVTQVSFDPALIAIAIRKDSSFYITAKDNEYLAIHFPSKKQQAIVASFFKVKDKSDRTINGYNFKWSELNNPLLEDLPMILEVKVTEIVERGDHPIFICEVVNSILREDVKTLSMADTNWHYGG